MEVLYIHMYYIILNIKDLPWIPWIGKIIYDKQPRFAIQGKNTTLDYIGLPWIDKIIYDKQPRFAIQGKTI